MQESNKKACSDNIETAENFLEEHGDNILLLIRSQIKDETDAEELFQDFFLSLITRPIPKGVKNINNYLYRVLSAEIKDSVRQKKKRFQSSRQKYAKVHKLMVEGEPKTFLMAADETKNISKIIRNSLSEGEASAVTLRYKDNYNIKEIADKMKVNSRAVKRYLSVGLNKLRHVLEVRREEIKPAKASAKKAEERSTENIERLVLNVSVGEFSPEDEVAEGIVELYRALNAYYIASEGSGLVIDDWKNLVSDGVPVEVLS